MSAEFVKRRDGAPRGFFAVEAAGLRWLAEAATGTEVDVVTPVSGTSSSITLPRLVPTAATPDAAERLGRGLAAVHAAGAPWFGCPPAGWAGDGFIGDAPLPHCPDATGPLASSWPACYAELRLRPYLDAAVASGAVSPATERLVRGVLDRLPDGDERLAGPPEPPARLHGDLWSGNVVWTASGPVLIDPAAHGGHRETDLAMLALFGLPHLDRVLAAYDEAAPLAEGWRDRVPLHQLHPLLVHCVLFGSGYEERLARAARACP